MAVSDCPPTPPTPSLSPGFLVGLTTGCSRCHLGYPRGERGVMSVRLELTANQIGSNSVTPQSDSLLNRYSMSAGMK